MPGFFCGQRNFFELLTAKLFMVKLRVLDQGILKGFFLILTSPCHAISCAD